jgi:hypothetical protein
VRPLLAAARREGRFSTVVAGTLLAVSILAAARSHAPVLAILWGAGGLSALLQWQRVAPERGGE